MNEQTLPYARDLQTFLVKCQMVNILGFVSLIVFVVPTQLCCCSGIQQWVWLCFSKTLCTNTGGQPISCSLLTSALCYFITDGTLIFPLLLSDKMIIAF